MAVSNLDWKDATYNTVHTVYSIGRKVEYNKVWKGDVFSLGDCI
jgi:hypothetical protein